MPEPVLQAMVLADQVYREVSGKYIIAGTFTRYLVTEPKLQAEGQVEDHQDFRGPITRPGTPYLYLALAEVHGEVPLDIKFVDLSDSAVMFEVNLVVRSNDPVSVAEYILPMPPQILGNPIGSYSLDLLYQDKILGQWRVSVVSQGDGP